VLGWLAAGDAAAGGGGVVDQHGPASVTGRLGASGSRPSLPSITKKR
jgi:hypothetical protein